MLARSLRILYLARSLRVLLAVALLAAWQNALVHPIEHVDEHGGFVHLAGGHASHGHEGENGGPNALCDAIAALGACVNGSSKVVAASSHGGEVPDVAGTAIPSGSPLLAYRSQAPPSHS